MTTIIKAPEPADFLAMLPQLVGTDIRNSVVLVGFRGNRTHGAIRFDLPSASAPRDVNKRFTTTAIGTLCKIQGVESAVVVICTPEHFGETADAPSRELAEMLVERIERSGFGARGALCQAADGWASYLDREVPVGGHPLAEVAASRVLDDLPERDRRDIEDRSAPVHLPRATAAVRGETRRALKRYRAAMPVTDDGDIDAVFAPLLDAPQFIEDALDWDAVQLAASAPLLLFAVQGPPFRDQAMLQWATSQSVGDLLFDWAERGPIGTNPELDEVLGGLMLGIGPLPDPERIERGITVVLTLLTLADGKARLAPLCMAAWLNWALGRGSRAARYLDEAAGIDPDYGMVEVLSSMLGSGMLPEWAFASSPER